MSKTVSLRDVISDYINRYGLTEKARQFFLEQAEEEAESEGWERSSEQYEQSST